MKWTMRMREKICSLVILYSSPFVHFPLFLLCPHPLFRDYAQNELLDHYSEADIDDDGDAEELTAAGRREAERLMGRRDRLARGGKGARALRRSRAPAFLGSDDLGDDELDEDRELARMRTRVRNVYDERRDIDDLDGIEDVNFPLSIIPLYLTTL
jgi:DNA replication licensing factor MCM2